MAANVFATPGSLYLAPTDATTGGTLIGGIEEQSISLVLSMRSRLRRNGVGSASGFRVRHGRLEAPRLIVPLRQQDATALKILFSHLTTDGSTFRPVGGTATDEFAKLPTFSMVLRPSSTGEKYIYSPNWAVTDESAHLIMHSEQMAQLDGAALVLVATRPTDAQSGSPAYLWDSAANIDTAFGL
jgi:hypothetical protein